MYFDCLLILLAEGFLFLYLHKLSKSDKIQHYCLKVPVLNSKGTCIKGCGDNQFYLCPIFMYIFVCDLNYLFLHDYVRFHTMLNIEK